MRLGRVRRTGLTLIASLLLAALPRLARADGPGPVTPNVEVLPPLPTSATPAVPATPSLVVPLDETRAQRRRRLRVRVYDGSGVPPEMHVEKRYASSQKVPLYTGVAIFGGAYALTAFVALDTHPVDGVLLIPVGGPLFRGAEAFNHMGKNTGMFSGLADAGDFVVGLMGFVDGILQGTGVVLTAVGISQMSKGPMLHLVPDEARANEARATRREPLRVAVRPLGSIGGTPATGLRVTLTAF
ncbi:MAG: hypothetical protein JWM74_972 [Myxococcaceae bacterium]|nr:hypothetical protein [Myxococcaceae bacterium]